MNALDLFSYLDNLLQIHEIKDYGPQGVQVESSAADIQKIALMTDTSAVTIQAAAEWGADMMFVHHGIFWGGSQPLRGPLGKRVRLLIENNIHLYAAHLALDAHPEYGNNAGLAQKLGLTDWEWFGKVNGVHLGVIGTLPTPLSVQETVATIDTLLSTESRLFQQSTAPVQKIALLSGSGIKYMPEAKALGADLFITGETDHASYYMADDYDINVVYAGHYATETVGVQLIGQHLTETFRIETKFFDFPTGM